MRIHSLGTFPRIAQALRRPSLHAETRQPLLLRWLPLLGLTYMAVRKASWLSVLQYRTFLLWELLVVVHSLGTPCRYAINVVRNGDPASYARDVPRVHLDYDAQGETHAILVVLPRGNRVDTNAAFRELGRSCGGASAHRRAEELDQLVERPQVAPVKGSQRDEEYSWSDPVDNYAWSRWVRYAREGYWRGFSSSSTSEPQL
ncbi:hypothetical protein EXIGLDRAFT_174581 [Exidia glandulosa HHB12029]|uniref:Uncharacterized protein n=1 Tax=Exidia glandulosa HHB12029 TaxID=1314781 RepID=A0A165F7D0_EXIGL|nr:hypothetical protein EXIGLDRAFT_174581 [Exidia glandulosa HHB12029]